MIEIDHWPGLIRFEYMVQCSEVSNIRVQVYGVLERFLLFLDGGGCCLFLESDILIHGNVELSKTSIPSIDPLERKYIRAQENSHGGMVRLRRFSSVIGDCRLESEDR